MTLPGFTAEVSAHGASGHHPARWRRYRDAGEIVPMQKYCYSIFISCLDSCGLSEGCICFCGKLYADCGGFHPPPCQLYPGDYSY